MQSRIKEWVHRCEGKPIPVMPHTIEQLRKLSQQDDLPLQVLVDVIEHDPGLTVQLLRNCVQKNKSRLHSEINSLQQALMLMGTRSATTLAMQSPSVNKTLQDSARAQLLRVFCRAYQAGNQALAWARLRRDMNPDEVFVATQLHFLGEMMLAMYAPDKLLEIFALRQEKNIASEEAQYFILGFTLDQLSLALAQAWHLPALVIDALHAENAQHPRAYGVMLAVQLVRAVAIDWYSEKTRNLVAQAAEWLGVSVEAVLDECQQIAIKVAQQGQYHGVLQTAALLPRIHTVNQPQANPSVDWHPQTGICLIPQLDIVKDTILQLAQAERAAEPIEKLLSIAAEGMHDGIGLNRVIFAVPVQDPLHLQPRVNVGADNDPTFNRFDITLKPATLFYHLLEKPQAICINDQNRKQYWQLVPAEVQKLLGTNSFMAMSIFIQNRAYGLFYADRHTRDCQLDSISYQHFKKICQVLTTVLSTALTKKSYKKLGS